MRVCILHVLLFTSRSVNSLMIIRLKGLSWVAGDQTFNVRF